MVSAPTILRQKIKDITIIHVGRSLSAIDDIARQAEKDLGFRVIMQAETGDTVLSRALGEPDTFDIYDYDHWTYKLVLPSGVLQGIPLDKYKWWDDTLPLFTKGTLPDGGAMSREGTHPYTVQYLDNPQSTEFAQGPTDTLAMVPHMMNADTLGVRPDLVNRPVRNWSELVNPEYSGRTALVSIPYIGIMDAAMAFQSAGSMKYGNKGDMTREEIEGTIELLIELKRSGHFHSFWSIPEESVESLASGEVVIQSMWSPAVSEVRARGIACDYPPLEEGYRGWASGLGIMRHVKGLKLEAAYEYLNWYGSGWAGAVLAHEGYYNPVPGNVKKFLSEDEWSYWYEGKPAAGQITDPYGSISAQPGDTRFGGALWDRMGNIACWNTVMRENGYLIERWNEFLSA